MAGRDSYPRPTPSEDGLRDLNALRRRDGRSERDGRLARPAVRRVGEERVIVRLGKVGAVERIGVRSVGELIAEAVVRELRRCRPDQVIDRVAVVARNA